ncbi:hypothetical protein [Actinosynnema sp.]|uniref:hypothetical protein n=1 Tax=Actinosynnema sp. TaxID=1872144 RepID=UPI003F82D546
MADGAHGVALAERAVESVRRDPHRSMFDFYDHPWVEGEPEPAPAGWLAGATFPSGRPLPPSLRAWLAFDTGLLRREGWFTDDGELSPRPLDRVATECYGPGWGELYAPLAGLFPECFLLPGGSDSRRVYAVGEPDSTGEHPVLALDVDDLPFVGLMYPGFDVYLAVKAGIVDIGELTSYTQLADHPVYGPRMREHARTRFGGRLCAEYPEF